MELLRVRALMTQLALRGPLSVARVSQELGMTCRTFQRQLSRYDTTFRAMRAEVQLEMARVLLRQTDLPVQEIARQLGYCKPGAFARAFAGWTGLSPRHYRRSGRR